MVNLVHKVIIFSLIILSFFKLNFDLFWFLVTLNKVKMTVYTPISISIFPRKYAKYKFYSWHCLVRVYTNFNQELHFGPVGDVL